MTRLLALALLLTGCGFAVSSTSVEALECGMSPGGALPVELDGCYINQSTPGCLILEPGDPCGSEPASYVGGVPYEAWCPAWVPVERRFIKLQPVECPPA